MASLFLALITIVGFWINYLLNFVRVYLAGKRIRRLLKEMFSSGTAKRWTRSSRQKRRNLDGVLASGWDNKLISSLIYSSISNLLQTWGRIFFMIWNSKTVVTLLFVFENNQQPNPCSKWRLILSSD